MDLREKKEALEESIRQLVAGFRKETGLFVDHITIERVTMRVGPFSEVTDKVTVKVSV